MNQSKIYMFFSQKVDFFVVILIEIIKFKNKQPLRGEEVTVLIKIGRNLLGKEAVSCRKKNKVWNL